MSTISAGTTSNTALKQTGDTTGNLVLQTNGTTTAMTISSSQIVSLTSNLALLGATSGSVTIAAPAVAGSTTLTLPSTSGTLLQSGTAVTIAQGGTGQTTASAAFDALAPSQTSNSGKYLTTNGTTTSWGTVSGGSPAGSNTQIQYNNSGAFGASSNLTFDGSTLDVNVSSGSSAIFQLRATNASAGAFLRIAGGNLGLGTGNFDIIQGTPGDVYLQNRSNQPIYFYTNSTERVRISADGNLRVPAMYGTTVTTPRNVFIDSSGNMGGISSVRESKTNISALSSAAWVQQLNPVTFNYRKKDEDGKFTDEFEAENQFGLIAEDVEAIQPDLCVYVAGKLQGVHYDRMIAPLIKAIQELTARVAALEAK
jgi:hypothetical protein